MSTPSPCDPEVFKYGRPVLVTAEIKPSDLEKWVKRVAEISGQRVDWYFMAGHAVIKVLGDVAQVRRVMNSPRIELDRLYLSQIPESEWKNYSPFWRRAYWREVWPP